MSVKTLDLTCSERIGPQLKVWWKPQIPMASFEVLLNSFAEAKVILETLPRYDAFQLENNIKPDYSNTGGLTVFEDGEWVDYYTEDGADLEAISLGECVALDREFHNAQLEAK